MDASHKSHPMSIRRHHPPTCGQRLRQRHRCPGRPLPLDALGANYVNNGDTLVVSGTSLDTDGDGLPDFYEDKIIDFDPNDAVDTYQPFDATDTFRDANPPAGKAFYKLEEQ